MASASLIPPQERPVLRDCVETLSRVAAFRLPGALDRRLVWLSENKEQLDESQREELAALVDLADNRALDKLQAQAVLAKLAKIYPELANAPQ
jgi:hypothetical protein